jgi:hypothetical protein
MVFPGMVLAVATSSRDHALCGSPMPSMAVEPPISLRNDLLLNSDMRISSWGLKSCSDIGQTKNPGKISTAADNANTSRYLFNNRYLNTNWIKMKMKRED